MKIIIMSKVIDSEINDASMTARRATKEMI